MSEGKGIPGCQKGKGYPDVRRERNVRSYELNLMRERLESAWAWTKARIVVSIIVAGTSMFVGFRYGGWMTSERHVPANSNTLPIGLFLAGD
jgi:hypothetical protein